jgi:hypothetical protein
VRILVRFATAEDQQRRGYAPHPYSPFIRLCLFCVSEGCEINISEENQFQ